MDDRDMAKTSSASSPTTAPLPAAAPTTIIDLGPKTEFSFDFALDGWANLTRHKVYSSWNYWAGYKWRLLIFPRGYCVDTDISVYVECGGPCEEPPAPAEDECEAGRGEKGEGEGGILVPNVPAVWRQPARIWLSLIPTARTTQGTEATTKAASHAFTKNEPDWGFREFCRLSDIEKNSFCDEEGKVSVGVRIRLRDDVVDSTLNCGTRNSELRSSRTAAVTNAGTRLAPRRLGRWICVICGSGMAIILWLHVAFAFFISIFGLTGGLKNGWKAGFCAFTASKVEQVERSDRFCAEVEGRYGETLKIIEKRMVPRENRQDASTVIDLKVCTFLRRSDAEEEGHALLVRNHGIFSCWIKANEVPLFGLFDTASETLPWPTTSDAKLSRANRPGFDPFLYGFYTGIALFIAWYVTRTVFDWFKH